MLPGAFNVAASTVMGGYHAGANVRDAVWTNDSERREWEVDGVGMRPSEAKTTFRAGCVMHGNEELRSLLEQNDYDVEAIKPVKTETHLYLEVVAIVSPAKDEKIPDSLQPQASEGSGTEHPNIQALGKLLCKPYAQSTYHEYDLPSVKETPHDARTSPEYTFLVEEAVLKTCYPGLKMSVTVLTLPGGMHILDEIKETYCSFYKVLPNELMTERKTPKFRLMNRHIDGLEMGERVEADRVEEMEPGMMDDEGYDSDEAD